MNVQQPTNVIIKNVWIQETTMTSPQFRVLPVSALFVDDRYQRELNEARVKKIAETFNPAQLGVLEVSTREDGMFAVFDGQHRLAALQQVGWTDAPCLVHQDLTADDEAKLFIRLQSDRKSVTPLERFRARLFSGDETAVVIDKVTRLAGFHIGGHDPYGIKAVTAVEAVYRREGPDALLNGLAAIHNLWGGDERSTNGHLIQGMTQFLLRYSNRLGNEEQVRLAGVAPSVVLRKALGPMTGGEGRPARDAVETELRKIAGVRGRPLKQKKVAA